MTKNKLKIFAVVLSLALLSCCVFCNSFSSSTPPKEYVVVIDPGHGGIDGGAVGVHTGNKESDLVLDISKFLSEYLERAGIGVVLTRRDQNGLYGTTESGFKRRDMQKRKEITLSANPSLLVSIHLNKHPSSSRRGVQAYYQKSDDKSSYLAQNIQDVFNTHLNMPQQNRKYSILSGDFWMCKIISPSVIIECGFLSNKEDDSLLDSREYRKHVAYLIFNGIITYLINQTDFIPKNL